MDNGRGSGGFSVLLAFLLGTLVGAVVSLLFAPVSGREAREKIRAASDDAKNRTREATTKVKETTRDKVTHIVDQGRTRIDEATESLKAAVEAGRTAFIRKKTEMSSAVSNDGGQPTSMAPGTERQVEMAQEAVGNAEKNNEAAS